MIINIFAPLDFQYAILLTIVVTIQMKYVLHIIDLRSENPWDNKAVYLLYTELITGKSITFTLCSAVISDKLPINCNVNP